MSLWHVLFVLPLIACTPASALGPGDEFQDCDSCPAMVVIPAGTFAMGSPAEEEDRQDLEGPAHDVKIARTFAVGKFEVTVEEYLACVAATGCREPEWREAGNDRNATTGSNTLYKTLGSALTDPRNPIVGVDWNDAEKYASWLSQKTGQVYRLLSEAEWEYAARAGTTTHYFWGDDIGTGNANCDGCGSSWDNQQTAPVGSFAANAFGLYDMHGNVSEWVEDCWNETYEGAPSDGSAWMKGNCEQKIMRGASWPSDPVYLRSAYRFNVRSDNRYDDNGFRIARDLD